MLPRIGVYLTLILCGLGGCSSGEREGTSPGPEGDAATVTPPGCTITMGWDPWEPYQYLDQDGKVRGLDIEIVSAIARAAGCTLKLVEGEWATLLVKLKDGEVDLLTGATRTESREGFAYFSDPYREEAFALYLRSEEAAGYAKRNLEQLLKEGFRVGVTLEYVYGDKISSLQDDPRYERQFDGVLVGEVNYAKLLNMEIDGFLEDPIVANAIMRRKGLKEDIKAHPDIVKSGEVCLMLSRASVEAETVQRLNDGLAKIKQDGTYGEILAKYRS